MRDERSIRVLAPILMKVVIVILAVMVSWFYVIVPSSLLWAAPYASWLAQTCAPVGVSEADVRAALGRPREVLAPGEEIASLSRRPIQRHALLYYREVLICGNWIAVYIGEDGLVKCSVATVTGSG